MKFSQPTARRLSDPDAEKVRQEHAQVLREITSHPVMQTKVIPDVSLPDATVVQVAHGLGRAPSIVKISTPRGAASAGYINELRDGTSGDRSKTIALKASGYGATITVDIEVA